MYSVISLERLTYSIISLERLMYETGSYLGTVT